MLHQQTASRHGAKGFGIVEIMVGMVIGMLGILVVMNIFAISEGQKRTTTSGSDAQTNGGIALHLIERDVRMAGYGFASMFAYGNICPAGIQTFNSTQVAPNDVATFNPAPVQIDPIGIPAGDANTSVISVMYSNSSRSIDGIDFQQASPGAGSAFLLAQSANRASFNLGDTVIVIPNSPGLQCTTIEVTGLPGSNQCGTGGNTGGVTDSNAIVHTSGVYENFYQNCQQTSATHNRPAGAGVDYWTGTGTDGRLFIVGGQPAMRTYAVRNGTLTVCDGMANNCSDGGQIGNTAVWVPVAGDIASLRAVYGRDTNLDGVVDQWNTAGPADAREVVALRVAVVARSGLQEKINTGTGQCDVTTAQPTWKGSAEGAPVNLSAIANWGCYRYKTFQTTIPIRSMIWKTQ